MKPTTKLTDEELKKVAKYAAKFLGDSDGIFPIDGIHQHSLFHDDLYSPHFAHLALQEILKRRYRVVSVSAESIGDDNSVTISGLDDQTDQMYTASDNNYFIALWSAIERTG